MADARPTWRERLERLGRGVGNAVELMRKGRLGPAYEAPFTVAWQDAHVTLRRYARADQAAAPRRPILLVPPLMVTAAIYDISPELSAVGLLAARGADVWLCDFGTPEDTPGGLDRTLDDHVLAVSRAIDHIVAATGHDAHLVGYSQGGLFCYQAAAFRKSSGLASIVAFGAPVDIHRNAPLRVNDAIAGRLVALWRRALDSPITGLRALPGTMSSRGFKLMAPLQEVKHLVQLLGLLPDREAFAQVEPKRRFLGGEGFIAWPGPALRTFIDDFVVQNRLKQGGFVIAGRTTALADITCPILYAIGEHDGLAQPAAVKAIAQAAPHAATWPLHLAAGHFGLVVGGLAMAQSWPTVLAWAAWHDGVGERPELLTLAAEHSVGSAADAPEADSPRQLQDWLIARLDRLWSGLGTIGLDLGALVDRMRSKRRQRRLEGMDDTLRVSFARALSDRAAKTGAEVFFVWQGRAYTYAEADARVSAVARELIRAGVTAGGRVGLFTDVHPDVLAALGAANRLGAIAVPIAPHRSRADLVRVVQTHALDVLVVDATHRELAREAFAGPVLMLSPLGTPAAEAPLPPHDQGRGGDVALVLGDHPISNRDQIATALAAAIALQLGHGDTVYSPLPLHEAPGLLVGVGAGLVGGARLALGAEVDAAAFWSEVRNIGATVVVLDAPLARRLLDAPPRPEDRLHPVRVLVDVDAGQGPALAPDVQARMLARFSSRPGALLVKTITLATG